MNKLPLLEKECISITSDLIKVINVNSNKVLGVGGTWSHLFFFGGGELSIYFITNQMWKLSC